MKTFNILYFFCALFVTSIHSQTNVSGVISQNTVWDLSGSPFIVTENILVQTGSTLTIEAGVTVKVDSGVYIKVEGTIIAIGESSNKITFSSNSLNPSIGDWDKIWLSNTSVSFDNSDNYISGTVISNCIISQANEGLRIDDSSFYLENTEITNNMIGINFRKVNNSIIKGNSFNNNFEGTSTSAGTENNGIGLFTYTKFLQNIFENNTGSGLSFGGYRNNSNNNLIQGNLVKNNGGDGMHFQWGDVVDGFTNNVIENNIIYNNGNNGITICRDSNVIQNNYIINNGGKGINISGTYVYIGLTIEHNIISGNNGFGLDLSSNNNSLVQYNSILNSSSASLIIPESYIPSSNNTISYNTFVNSTGDLIKLAYGPNTFNFNNFFHNSSGSIMKQLTGNTSSINAENNYWNTNSESDIQLFIHDFYDDFELGEIDYLPFSVLPETQAPISPPTNVIKEVSGSDVIISWTENTESDLTGYKLYFGNPTGYSYSESIDLGNVTTHTIAGGDINNEFAITAYDSSIDGTDDMVDGNESWYSIANTVPELPSSVTIEAAPRKSRLNWTPSTSSDINKYIIYRGITTDPTEVLTEVIDPTDVFFVDTDLTQGSNYFYRIKSVSTAGVESDFSQNYSVVIPAAWIVSTTPGPLDVFGSSENPYNTIQAAIDQSINEDAVVVYPGTYQENVLIFEKNVSVTTPDPQSSAPTTIIDGGANGLPVFRINGNGTNLGGSTADLVVSGFTIRNGLSPTYEVPGGLYVSNTNSADINITLSHLVVEDNVDLGAGGASAGGSHFYYTDFIEVSDVVYRNNFGPSAAMGAFNAQFSLDRGEFYNNTSSGATINFWHNSNSTEFTTIRNTLIRNNSDGGALNGMDAILLNSTIVENGSQMYFRGSSAIVNSIIGGDQFISSTSGLLNVSNSHISDGLLSIDIFPNFLTYENNIEGDIYFLDESSDNFRLSDYAPGIGSGTNSILLYSQQYDFEAASYLDLDAEARPSPSGSNVDMGAYENILAETVHNSEIYVSISDGSNINSVGLQSAPFKTIQAAVDYSIDADNINVLPGVYQEQVIVANKGISLLSTVPLGAQINLLISSASLMTFTSNVGVKVSTVEGFYLSGTGTAGSVAFLTNDHYLRVKSCKVIDFQSAMHSQVSAVEAINSLFVNNHSLAFNDNCTTGPGPITPLIKNCTIIGSIVIHSACPSISIDILNSIILKEDIGVSGYAAPPFFSKVLTNNVNIVPQSGSSFAVLPNGVEDIYFTDYIGGDYTLSEFSPALGYGTFPVSEDILGNSRPMPVGSSLDAGAFESPLGSPSNAAPRFDDIAVVGVNEDAALTSFDITGVVDGDILQTQDLLFSVSSDNPSLFDTLEIVYNQGDNTASLSHSPALNQNGTANVTVTLSDDGNGDPNAVNSTVKSFVYTVAPVNDGPTDIALSNQTLEENTSNVSVGVLSAVDVDDTTFSYSLVAGQGDQDNANFEINAGELIAITPFDYESSNEAFIRLMVTDRLQGAGLTFEKEFVITILDINDAPVGIDQSVTTDEDTLHLVTLTATDQDDDPLTYTIVDQPLNGSVVLNGDQAEYTPDANYNGPDSFTFTANDGTIDSNVATVSIDVIPVNDAPTSIEITSSSIVENVIAAVGLISCVDPDADDVYIYELVSGSGDTNNNLFQIIGDELYNIDPLNFETQELYSVRIKASNVNDEIEQAFSIQVTNVNDINIVSVLQDSYCEGATGDGQITITEVNEVSGNVLFDWTGPNGFTSQNQSISNLEPGLYNLELTDDFFTYIESFSVGLIPVYENLEICYVSGDSNEPTKNRIYLNKEGNYNVAAYRVFRETTIADEYEQIGLVLPTDDSFLDNDSNNLIRQYKYKVATVDNCGIESITSPVHFNSFLQANLSSGGSVNLFWEPYVGLSYDSFYIYRSLNGLPFLLLDVLPSNQTVYNDITADVNTNDYTYYIGIFTEPCEVPAPVAGGGSNRMLSIIVESNPIIIINGTLDVAEIMDFSKVVVYPNPTTSGLSIMCDDLTGYSLTELYTINGQLLQSTKSKSISLANYQNGVYLLKIFTSSGVTFKRIIKDRIKVFNKP